MSKIANIKSLHQQIHGKNVPPSQLSMQRTLSLAQELGKTIADDGRFVAPFVRIPKGMRFEKGKLVPRK